MRILVTGSNGTLGSDLVKVLSSTYEVFGLGYRPNRHADSRYIQTDISNPSAVLKAVSAVKPAIIIHAAAYTNVDACETNPYQAFLVNVKGTECVAQASDEMGATLFFISTDYVFDGTKHSPYEESDTPNPLSVYGRSKLEAEEFLKARCRSAWIIRSSWLFGANGRNFFRAMLERIQKGEELKVVDDQKGAPTYTKDLAQVLRSLIEKGNRAEGCIIYHLANGGETTWFQAAKKLLEKMNSKIGVKPISSQELKRPAQRPANSVFNMTKIERDYDIKLRSWNEAFDEFWEETLKREWENSIVSQSP